MRQFENVSKFTANSGRIKNWRVSTVGQYMICSRMSLLTYLYRCCSAVDCTPWTTLGQIGPGQHGVDNSFCTIHPWTTRPSACRPDCPALDNSQLTTRLCPNRDFVICVGPGPLGTGRLAPVQICPLKLGPRKLCPGKSVLDSLLLDKSALEISKWTTRPLTVRISLPQDNSPYKNLAALKLAKMLKI